MKRGRAPCPDGIPAEMLAYLDIFNRSYVLALINKSWEEGKVPESWKRANITCIYRKSDDALSSHYKPVSLLNSLYKLFSKMLHTRSSAFVEPRLRNTQHVFRSNKSTQTPIQVVYRAQQLFHKT